MCKGLLSQIREIFRGSNVLPFRHSKTVLCLKICLLGAHCGVLPEKIQSSLGPILGVTPDLENFLTTDICNVCICYKFDVNIPMGCGDIALEFWWKMKVKPVVGIPQIIISQNLHRWPPPLHIKIWDHSVDIWPILHRLTAFWKFQNLLHFGITPWGPNRC